jgi:hypothetical protein
MDTTQLHAYPHDTGLAPCKGLTKREWYAGLAMMALIPHATAINANSYELADRAFQIADAMVYAIQKDELGASK